jgi:hypothetical protein
MPGSGGQQVMRMNMNFNNNGRMSSNTLDHQINDLSNIFQAGRLQEYINHMMGQPHLTPASSH